jgi:NAD(P)H-dependent flavin oxidoreductase YrpB (nitropropane dioxygenase family)
MLTTPLCQTLGITAPIFSVGMGALAGPALAAAVSNAGACGVLGRVSWAPTAHPRQQIRQVRTLTDKPFGVNIILATLQAEWIDLCFEERVPLLVFFWTEDARGREQTPLRMTTGIEFARLPDGYASDWHTASRHASAIILSGQMECTVGDGTVRRLGPGDVLLAEGFTGQGHFNRVMDDQPLLVAFVRV